MMLAEDGSGKGAGLVSAIAQRIKARSINSALGNGHGHGQQSYHGKTTMSISNGKTMESLNGHSNGHSK